MRKKLTKEQFIFKARQVHGWKYDYSKVEYVNNKTKVCIICPEHGEFWQTPNNHLRSNGCHKCGIIKESKQHRNTLNDFIEKAKQIHGDRYDYSCTKYINSTMKVDIKCKKHGVFSQNPNSHLQGCGCPKCNGGKIHNTEDFIKMAHEIHGDKYDYSKTEYVNASTKVCIICKNKDKYGNEHGVFWQLPGNHVSCKHSCPKCRNYKLEDSIRKLFVDNNICFEEQKTFDWLKNGRGRKTLDFYLPNKNIAIECQGIQHFIPVDFSGKGKKWANEKYKKTVTHDKYKKEQCEKHGIKVLYYSNIEIVSQDNLFNNKMKLLEKINEL